MSASLKFVLTFVLFLGAALAAAGEISFVGKTDKDPLAYKPGETVTFSVTCLEEGKAVDGRELVWTLKGDDGQVSTGKAVSSASKPLVVKGSISSPGFLWLQVCAKNAKGHLLTADKYQFNGGAGVLLDQIKGFPEPADFDAFWARQKAKLAKVPMRADQVAVDSGNKNIQCWDVKVDCVGKPVSGYLCKPKDAKAKSLPAYVYFHGYGVHSAGKVPMADAITLNINAHGMINGQPKSFYEEQRKTTLSGYGLNPKTNEDPETCYWNGMMMRVMRALEFVKSQPEWDGKNLIVCGGSQGGFQSLNAAGLDSDVSECRPVVPWFCDVSGFVESKRIKSRFMPEWVGPLGYYDAANHAKRIKATVTIDSGLGDYVCPPSGQMVMYNNIKSPKKLIFSQGRTHGYHMKDATTSTLSSESK